MRQRDLIIHCCYFLDKTHEGYSEAILALSGKDKAEIFFKIISLVIRDIPPAYRFAAEDFENELGVGVAQVEQWLTKEGLPDAILQTKVVTWIYDIQKSPAVFHGIRFKNTWYLSSERSPQDSDLSKRILPPNTDLTSDDARAYRNMGYSKTLAQKAILKLQARDSAQAELDAFEATEFCVAGVPKPVTYAWQIVDERSFSRRNPALCWPKTHPDVFSKPIPRHFINRADAEFICEPIAQQEVKSMGPDEDEAWELEIRRDDHQTVYIAVDPDDYDDSYAIGWIKRIEVVSD